MATMQDVAEVIERFRSLTVTELAALLHIDASEAQRLLDTDTAREFSRFTGAQFQGSPVVEFRKSRKPIREFTDDEVLSMWEMYTDLDVAVSRIAREFDTTVHRVEKELVELGALEKTSKQRNAEKPPYDPADPFKGLDNDERIRVENIMVALGKINDPDDAALYNRHLPFARSLPHVKANTRARVPQSERQRKMDRLGSGFWATIVRADMRRQGLLPRFRG